MSYATDHPDECRQPECLETVPGSRWHRQKAQEEGWFFPNDQEPGAWCPKHKPAWVNRWRARRDAR